MGQLVKILRAEYLVDCESYTKVDGLPIFTRDVIAEILARVGGSPNGEARERNGHNGAPPLTKADFSSDQETRWCPGCGDYAVLASVQSFMPELGIPPDRIVFVTGHRLRGPLRLLHGHLRDARHPRPRAGARHRRGHLAAGPLGLGGERRRRRPLDRRQPPDPRAAPQRAAQDPAVQQPDLRPHEGPVLAHERGGQGHEVHALRLPGPPVQPGGARARRRGHLRGAHAWTPTSSTWPRRCARPRRTGAPRSSRSTRTATCSTTAPSTPCAPRGSAS